MYSKAVIAPTPTASRASGDTDALAQYAIRSLMGLKPGEALPPLVAIGFGDSGSAIRAAASLDGGGTPRTTVQLALADTDKAHLVVSFAHEDITSTEVLKALASSVDVQGQQGRFAAYDGYFRAEQGETLVERAVRLTPGVHASGTLTRGEAQKLLAIEHSFSFGEQIACHARGGLEQA